MTSDTSQGTYRLPYVDGTKIKVFDDFTTHGPRGRIDFFAVEGQRPYRIVTLHRPGCAALQGFVLHALRTA